MVLGACTGVTHQESLEAFKKRSFLWGSGLKESDRDVPEVISLLLELLGLLGFGLKLTGNLIYAHFHREKLVLGFSD